MDQFRQVGEVVGSLKALMVLKHDISVNQRQCCLLFDMFLLAFETISEAIRQHLRLDERNVKWKDLEYPMKELHRVLKDGELYIRYCLDIKDWWGKAISLHLNRDCVDFHIHNLLCCFPVVIEAIEAVAEISALDQDDMQKRRSALMRKYDAGGNDPKLFQWMYGRQYLVPREICSQLDSASKEDRWLLVETIREKKRAFPSTLSKHQQRLGDLLLKKLNGLEAENVKLLPSSVLVGAYDYSVKRRIGLGEGNIKEIQWLGENFALRTFFGEIEPLSHEISLVLSLSHPNILQYLCGFYDEERKECFLVIELMTKSLNTHIKENCGQRKRLPFSLPVAVDVMLQIARGMEYLHSRKVYHGELNPGNILLKSRSSSAEVHFQAKVTGFGLSSIKSYAQSPSTKGVDPVIWYAPEVLAEQEQPDKKSSSKYSEKADIYSFGMLCFQLLTGKVPFEDSHLQGDKTVRNIRAGERPLFPYPSPKYLANLTRKCWHPNPNLRPSFSSICRILRYIKKILVINPDHGQPESPPPLVDYCDLEAGYSKTFPGDGSLDLAPVTRIPFELYAYRLVEKEKTSGSSNDKSWDLINEESFALRPASICGNEHLAAIDDLFLAPSDRRSVCSEIIESKTIGALFDQRSAISEIPNFKRSLSDQRSVGSVSPRRKFLLDTATDQRSVSANTPERKVSLTTGVDQRSPRCGSPERKIPPTTPTNQKSKKLSENPEKQMLPPEDRTSENPEKEFGSITAADHGPHLPGNLERKVSSRKIVHRKKLSEIPEFGPSSTSNQKSISSGTPEKKSEPMTIPCKSARPKNSQEKKIFNRKLGQSNTASSPGLSKDKSPKSSPARISRIRSLPAASSPTTKDNSPGSSPARKSRIHSVPADSPPRARKECSSPRFSSTGALKEYSSPISSPLNPCLRCSRANGANYTQ